MAETASARQALDTLRARGAARLDPVRVDLVDALIRRAAAHGGAARGVLDARVATLLAQIDATTHGHAAEVPTTPRRHPLAGLLDHAGGPRRRAAGIDPATVAFFRRTWARWSAAQRMAQSHSALPANAGPLHSQHVVHQALTRMRALSPAYFERFIGHVDALLWVEQTMLPPPPAAPPRKGGARRT